MRKLGLAGFLFFAVSLVCHLCSGLSARADTWQWRNPLPSGNNFRGCTFGNGKFVAVGANGCIQSSSNGVSWSVISQLSTNSLNGVAYGNGVFVAVGAKGTILTSADGLTWSLASSGTSNALSAIAYGNTTFLAVGASGTLLVSTNGGQWTAPNLGLTNDLSWVTFGNGQFLLPAPVPVGGWQSALTPAVIVTTDGSAWATNTLPEPPNCTGASVSIVTFANGLFAAHITVYNHGNSFFPPYNQDYAYSSSDGLSWSYLAPWQTGYAFNFLSGANGLFFDVERFYPDYDYFISSDGLSWSPISPAFDMPFYNLAYGAGQFVSVGDSGVIAASPDGTNWTTPYTNSLPQLSSIASSPSNVTVAVGGYFVFPTANSVSLVGSPSPIMVCTNGVSFSPVPGGATPSFTSVAWGTSNFVAVGLAGALQRSTDGLTWTIRPSGAATDLCCICFGNGLWVAVGMGGTIVTSANSLVWSQRSSGTSEAFCSVTYGGGQFVAVGQLGTVATSPDGINWTLQYVSSTASLCSVAYGNGTYVAVGYGGAVQTSPDGVNWTSHASGVTAPLYGIGFSGSQFVTFAFSAQPLGIALNAPNTILQSYDGITWSHSRSPADWRIIGVSPASATNGGFWAAGDGGTILQSVPGAPQTVLAGHIVSASGLFSLSVYNPGGVNFKIQSRTNFNTGSWADLVNITNSPPVVTWTNTNSANGAAGFYRVVPP